MTKIIKKIKVRKKLNTQWWLAKLDKYGNPKLVDGAHHLESNANKAFHLMKRLGVLEKDVEYAVAKVILKSVDPIAPPLNEVALQACSRMGLHE